MIAFRFKISIFLGFFLFIECESNHSLPCDLFIKNANLINIVNGEILKNKDVLLNDGKIIAIYDSNEKKVFSKIVIEATGKYLIPGLWDMHVHIADSSYFKLFIEHGIVGVRDMGGNLKASSDGCESLNVNKIRGWKDMIAKGIIPGPEIYYSGPPLSGTGWPTSLPARNEKELRLSLDSLQKLNVDFIKVYDEIPLSVYISMSNMVKELNIDFAGHLPEEVLISTAANAKQKSIEHVPEALLLCFADDKKILDEFMIADNYSSGDIEFISKWVNDCTMAIEALKENNTWLTPTLSVEKSKVRYNDSSWINNPLRTKLPVSIQKAFASYLDSKKKLDLKNKNSELLWWQAQLQLVLKMHKNGIGILAGTDASCQGGIPGYSLHEELQFLVDAGLSPLSALQTATLNPAKYFNKIDLSGTIAIGKIASLVLLDKNPLEAIGNTKLISAVIIQGKLQYIVKSK